MPEYTLYVFGTDGKFISTTNTFSDVPIDLADYLLPPRHTHIAIPEYSPETEIPVWDGSGWSVRLLSEFEPTLEDLKIQKKVELAGARYDAEVGGIVLNGIGVATDDRSQSKIAGAAMKAMQDSTYTCWWKGEAGWFQLDAMTILGIADAVRAHVQACFDRERELDAAVDLAETAEAVAAVTW